MKIRNFKRIIIFGLCAVITAVVLLVGAGLNDSFAKADLIVVPGNTIAADGTPSPRLRARLDAALRLFHGGYAPLIFVSGGVGQEGFDEAESMSNYLQKNGVPQKSIIIDSFGIDTAATAKNAAAYLRANNLGSVLVATQYFHVPRTKLALKYHGVKVVGAAHARYFEMRDIYSTLRETVAYVAYYAKSQKI